MSFRLFIIVIIILQVLVVGLSIAKNHKDFICADTRQKKMALIYNGKVSSEGCPEAIAEIAKEVGLNVSFISDISLLPGLLKKTEVFIIGGTGDDLSPLIKDFTLTVTNALKTYLRNGGRYLGICGGGFMASTGWEEDTKRIKALGIIPAESSVFQDIFDAKMLPICWLGKNRTIFFKAGPDFFLEETEEKVKIVAKYDNGNIAALMCTYGKGKVAVCGPHPEADESWMDEVYEKSKWVSSRDLAVSFLKELLSNNPVTP